MAADGPLTRARIEAFEQTAEVLSQTAASLRSGGQRLQEAAAAYVEQINAPAGVAWEGHTAASAFAAAHADSQAVYRAVDHAHTMADICQRGSDSLRGARRAALEAIAQAEGQNFTVGEDLSVTDNSSSNSPAVRAARQQVAVAHRNYIAHAVGRLQSENARIATQLNAGAAQMAGMAPAHWRQPLTFKPPQDSRGRQARDNAAKRQGKIQAVDSRTWKQDPPSPQPNPGGMTRTEAAERLKDVNRRIAEHNALKPWIETLPPHDPRRADFSLETKLLNDEKKQYLAVLPPQAIRPPTVMYRGEVLPGVPPGLISEVPTRNGEGWIYPIAPNQPGIDPRVVAIRVMEPTHEYPNGYVVYMNGAQPTQQTVNPFTGQVIPPTDPYAHIPLPKQ